MRGVGTVVLLLLLHCALPLRVRPCCCSSGPAAAVALRPAAAAAFLHCFAAAARRTPTSQPAPPPAAPQLVRAGDPGERVVLQFGKAEQDAFILDFNPMGEGGRAGGRQCAWPRCCWHEPARCLRALPRAPTLQAACLAPPAPPAPLPAPTPAAAAAFPPRPRRRAVLTASQAFGIVLSTFDSKLFL